MGDGDSLKLSSSYDSAPVASGIQGRTSLRVTYSGKGSEGWAGIYWLAPANNWGTMKGAGFDLTQAKRFTFWIRGEKGGERISEVAIGGVSAGSYPDSDRASIGPLKLSTKWEQYSIDLDGKDLRHIIGGFVFIVKRAENVSGARFYLDEMIYEPAVVSTAAVVVASPSVAVSTPIAEAPFVSISTPEITMNTIPEAVKKTITFDSAHKTFGNEALTMLNDVLKAAARDENSHVIVEGHTDSTGAAAVNLRLSQERARSVADYLIANGLDARKITVRGYGELRPLMPESARYVEVARRKNRRVEVTVEYEAPSK